MTRQDDPKSGPRGFQGGSRWPKSGTLGLQDGFKKAPRRAPRGSQEGHRAQVGSETSPGVPWHFPGALRGAPGTVPAPPGSDFATNLDSQNGPSEGKTVRFETYMPNCTARLKHTNIHIHAQYESTDLHTYISTYRQIYTSTDLHIYKSTNLPIYKSTIIHIYTIL